MSVYSDPSIINHLNDSIKQTQNVQKTSRDTKIESIKLTGTYNKMSFDESLYTENPPATFFIPPRANKKIKYKNGTINNVTNCANGNFHKWKLQGDTLICQKCKSNIRDTEYEPEQTSKICDNYKYIELQKKANEYCKNGKMHKIICKNEKNSSMCEKCDKSNDIDKKFTRDELDVFKKKLKKIHDMENKIDNNIVNNVQKKNKKESEYISSVINKTTSQYSKYDTQHKFNFISEFIKHIQSVVGTSVTINDEHVNLVDDIYIIEYDHMGNSIDKIELSEKDNKVTLKKNHPIFNTDVMTYIDTITTKVEVYYDSISNSLLG
jgi:hypothetical protein